MTTLSAIRVLVVDDHEMFTQSVMRLLGDEDDLDVVGGACTMGDAVALAVELAPDVVVMDHRLPDGDGITATTIIRDAASGPNVLLLTGDTDERLLARAIESGCSGFLTKDRAAQELVEAIRAVAQGEAWIPPHLITRLLPHLNRTTRGLGSDLTPRELDVLRLAAEGLANAAIAERLYLSVNTVRNHVQNAITKLHAHSKLEAVAVAVREGVISFPK